MVKNNNNKSIAYFPAFISHIFPVGDGALALQDAYLTKPNLKRENMYKKNTWCGKFDQVKKYNKKHHFMRYAFFLFFIFSFSAI